MSWRAVFCGVLTFVAATGVPQAQPYPSRPLRIIVPYPPGGTADVLGREIAARMTAGFGQQVLVDNRAGANGMIGADVLAKSAPDGYAVGILSSSHSAMPHVAKLPFDVLEDLAPLTLIAIVPGLLSVNANVPARTLEELIALAKAQPGKLTYGHPGSLSAAHLALEALKLQAGLDIVPIPYKGGGPALADLLSGQTHMSVSGPTAHLPHIATGRLRPIAVTAARRSTAVPDTPTVAEGGLAGFDSSEWYGLFAPAKMSAEHTTRLHAELVRAISSPEMKARMASVGAEGGAGTPAQFNAFFRTEMEKNGKLIRSLNLKAD